MIFIRRCVLLFAIMLTSLSHAQERQSIAVPDCTLIDDNAAYNGDEIPHPEQRLSMIRDALRQDMRTRGVF